MLSADVRPTGRELICRAGCRGGVQKRWAASSMFDSRPKKPKSSATATKQEEAVAKENRFRKVVKEPQMVSA